MLFIILAETCSDYNTCTSCHGDPGCGWCRDPSDTGLGTCAEGGYLSALESTDCEDTTHWFYEQCPCKKKAVRVVYCVYIQCFDVSLLACNCNGHSSCINQTLCVDCQDNTTGNIYYIIIIHY